MIGVQRNRITEVPYDLIKKPLTRVELHVHLEGTMRYETIWEIARKKNIKLPGDGSFAALKNFHIIKKGISLADFCTRFEVINQCIRGDLVVLERLAYEAVEDASKQGVAYYEPKLYPSCYTPENLVDPPELKKWLYDMTAALIKGITRGQREFGTKTNFVIMYVMGDREDLFYQMMDVIADKNFHGGKLVGIDVASIEGLTNEKYSFAMADAAEFVKKALQLGIPRTIHAAESGLAKDDIPFALDTLYAMRIGHGYRIAAHEESYNRVKKEQIHLECCPWSSLCTGAISPADLPHPVVKFFRDDFNVSISTDNSALTGTSLDDEYRTVIEWGLTEAHLVRGNFNAARSSFLPENEKADLIQNLSKQFGCTL